MAIKNMKTIRTSYPSIATLIALLVALHGTFVLATTLLDQFSILRGPRLTEITIDIPILIGVSLIYLSSLLMRRKQRAWQVAVLVYVFLLGLGVASIVHFGHRHQLDWDSLLRALCLPAGIIALLVVARDEFVVRSDMVAFRSSLKFAVIVLIIAMIYGITGFELLDRRDFHKEFSVGEAFHRTIDQFDLTTSQPLHAYTRRARVFQDSLSVVSVAAVAYVAISLFSPLRARYTDPAADRERMRTLLETYGAPSEDFFKLWPHDKHYFFSSDGKAGLALKVKNGVALCLGDSAGDPKAAKTILREFEMQCYENDWLPAVIHVEPLRAKVYAQAGYALQKIGEEAIVNIDHFESAVANNKYFRNIRNRFNKANYTFEVLKPPHHPDVFKRLNVVSNEWLNKPGRTERGFAMGYFSEDYIQQCIIFVARDAAGTIQAFMNQIPAPFDSAEANFDMLRYASGSPSNINDYLLTNFIHAMHDDGYVRVNLGLSPLVGLGNKEEKTLLDNFLYFAYANGDRLYSFSGLHRFKSKYEPDWSERFLAYKGGIRGVTKVTNALARIMKVEN
ncbi:MAG TPA: phosphatidylglycerol lysyltransferase domain-containing protein [Candidatus Saccharimonadales bacterium]|nr:phosphatidylglycerol lysyltransferase domain-containing protein [Candidatus Saccharimonadales bacterium]